MRTVRRSEEHIKKFIIIASGMVVVDVSIVVTNIRAVSEVTMVSFDIILLSIRNEILNW